MQKTKTQRLLYCQLQRDASYTGIGMPEYLVLFKKWDDGEPEPIRHYKSAEDAEKKGGCPEQIFSLEAWQKYASPVWFDIKRTDVLNAKIARSDRDEKHICPLQLEVIRRAIQLWTNPNDIVYSAFGGIGSEPYVALEQNRRAIAAELKPEYFTQMKANCEEITRASQQMTLFDNDYLKIF